MGRGLWWLVVGGWLVVVGGGWWWLVVGGWWLVVGATRLGVFLIQTSHKVRTDLKTNRKRKIWWIKKLHGNPITYKIPKLVTSINYCWTKSSGLGPCLYVFIDGVEFSRHTWPGVCFQGVLILYKAGDTNRRCLKIERYGARRPYNKNYIIS